MHKFKSEQEIRDHVGLLKNFYGEVAAYLFLNTAFIILWILAGGGYFWPIWPILVWFVSLVIKASKLHLIDKAIYEQCCFFRDKLPFIKSDWTEEKVKEFLVYMKATPATKKSAAKKPPAKKPVAKSAVRKATPKETSVKKKATPRKK